MFLKNINNHKVKTLWHIRALSYYKISSIKEGYPATKIRWSSLNKDNYPNILRFILLCKYLSVC